MSRQPPEIDEDDPPPAPDPLLDEGDAETIASGQVFQAGDRKQVRAQEKKTRQVERDRQEAMTALLATAMGRSWLYWLMCDLTMCDLFGESENAAFDSNALHYREGKRRIAVELQKVALLTNRENYTLMLAEHLGQEQ